MLESKRSETTVPKKFRRERWASWLAAGGTGVVALLMAVSGGSAAAVLHASFSVKAPYTGSLSSPGFYGSVSGCKGSVSSIAKPAWNSKTGNVTMAGLSKAAGCSAANSGSGSYINSNIQVAIPFKAKSNGTQMVTVNFHWNVTLTAAYTVNSKCPPAVINSYGYGYSSCDASAYASIGGYAHVEDLTNNTYWYPSNYWGGQTTGSSIYTSEDCYYGTCNFYNSTSHTFSTGSLHSFTWFINATMSAGEKIIVVLYINGYANANFYGYAKGSASAMFNLATLGNVGNVVSIKVT